MPAPTLYDAYGHRIIDGVSVDGLGNEIKPRLSERPARKSRLCPVCHTEKTNEIITKSQLMGTIITCFDCHRLITGNNPE